MALVRVGRGIREEVQSLAAVMGVASGLGRVSKLTLPSRLSSVVPLRCPTGSFPMSQAE